MKGEVFLHSCYISALCQLHKWKHKFTPGKQWSWDGGKHLENDHPNQQPVVAGLLAVKQPKYECV